MTTNYQELWDKFSDTPVNDDEEETIDEDFHIFKKGTPKQDIWHWFDDKTNGRIPPRC